MDMDTLQTAEEVMDTLRGCIFIQGVQVGRRWPVAVDSVEVLDVGKDRVQQRHVEARQLQRGKC